MSIGTLEFVTASSHLGTMTALAVIVSIAATQGGYISRPQILNIGLTDGFIAAAIERGDLVVMTEGIYRATPMSGEGPLLRGAVLALPGGVVSHSSAARLHQFPYVRKGQATVTVHQRTTHVFPGVAVRRSLDMLPEHRTKLDGLETTTIARTLVDLAADLHPRHLERVTDALLTEGRADYDRVCSVLADVARRGRPGTRSMRNILAIRGEGLMVTATQLERLGHRVLRAHGVEEPIPQYPVPWDPDRRFDGAYPPARLALEWDSRRWHSSLAQMESDRMRDRECAVHSWLLMRITWHDLKQRPGQVAQQIAAVLDQRLAG